MKKNELIKSGSGIYRILHIQNDNVLVIDCVKMTMPNWVKEESLGRRTVCAPQYHIRGY